MTAFNKDSFSLKGKVALVTGGASGLGLNYSIALSMYGADDFIVSRSQKGWDDAQKAVEDNGQKVGFLQKDITEEGAAAEVIQAVLTEFGHLDILVNNAGMQIRNDVLDFKDADWQKVINLNLNALYYLSHEAAKVMAKQKRGKIINIGSMQSYRAGKFIFHCQQARCFGIDQSLCGCSGTL